MATKITTVTTQETIKNDFDSVDCAYIIKGFLNIWESLTHDQCDEVKALYGEGELEFMGGLWDITIKCSAGINAVVDFNANTLDVFPYEHLDDVQEGSLVRYLWDAVVVDQRDPTEAMSMWAEGHGWVQLDATA